MSWMLMRFQYMKMAPFIDLCKGPHVEKTSQIGAIKLLKVSGAYWRGSENKMLQRIYGTAFSNPKELKQYLFQLEEAKSVTIEKLEKNFNCLAFRKILVGLVLWHPRGAAIRQVIEDLWRSEHQKHGYETVFSPHVGRGDLWKTSGHLDFYQENMFASMDIDDIPYFMKPMNCPFHCYLSAATSFI